MYWAHSLGNDPDPSHWQDLDTHLLEVAKLAANFAEPFSSQDWAYLAGLWHDLGKYQQAFQDKLQGRAIAVEHSGAGAALAIEKHPGFGVPLAFAIAAHHGGLANKTTGGDGYPTPLGQRVRANTPILEQIRPDVPNDILNRQLPVLPAWLKQDPKSPEFWIRFLFSALVDADWLDTEVFLDPERAELRGQHQSIKELQSRLDVHVLKKISGLSSHERESPVNKARAEILGACRSSARLEPGLFSLTAPTGGGKTLSSMVFALDHAAHHAEQHGLRRVIVVIPYTSIIEQNAEAYREALGTKNIIEHHSNLDVEAFKTEHDEETVQRHELATENWDAPIVVTTSVQFFESLFSNRRSRCRKLHNIAKSVIILDEVQSVPPEFLLAILDALRELATHYGCSIVLSTATQPALGKRESLPQGLEGVREITPDPSVLMTDLKRVTYDWSRATSSPTEWPELADELAGEHQVLSVVHKRNDARELAQLVTQQVPEDTVFHLSALMCAKHRTAVIAEVRAVLKQGAPCRLISTQLIEAGVDVDFPVVYRALSGLDSIVQAAGRCNREGRPEPGRVIVFRAPTKPPRGTPKRGMEIMEGMLEAGAVDTADPRAFEEFFRALYFHENLDAHNIQRERKGLNFAVVGRNFKLIEDGFTHPIVVPYGGSDERVEILRRQGPTRETLRALQPYLVQVYEKTRHKFISDGVIEEVCPGVYAIMGLYEHQYDDKFGLNTGEELTPNPEVLIVDPKK